MSFFGIQQTDIDNTIPCVGGCRQIQEMAPLIKAFNIINYSNAISAAVETNDHKGLAEVEDMSPLIKAFNIVNYSNAIAHAAETNDHKSLADFRLRLSGALDLYSLTNVQQEHASA